MTETVDKLNSSCYNSLKVERQSMERKKYSMCKFRDEYEEYLYASPSPADEKEYKALAEQDGTNWYCRRDEFDFRMVDSLDEIVRFFNNHYTKDIRLGDMSEADRNYILDKLNEVRV